MPRFALRRMLWAIPTLFGISLVVFLMTMLIPDPAAHRTTREKVALLASDPLTFDALAEERRQQFLDLPTFFNPDPMDVRTRAEAAVRHVAADDEAAPLGAHELARLGGAALPYVLPQLDKLSPTERARVAVALAPIAARLGEPASAELKRPERAVVFWAHFWEDRSLDFTEPALKRAVHRLVVHSTDLRERDLVAVDTFALHQVIPAMADAQDREAIRKLAALASHASGWSREIPSDASEAQLEDTVADWQAWWQVHRTELVALDGPERVAGTLTETRYGKWVLQTSTGRLGFSVIDGEPIARKLRARAPVTLLLTTLALLVSFAVAVPLGAIGAWRRGRTVDRVLTVTLFALYSMPTFWAAQLLARACGRGPGLVAPVIALSLGSLASLSRYQRGALLDVFRQEYVRAARARGASPLRLIVVHALRNALMPAVTLAGLQFPALLGGSFVVEEVFAVPGLGYETLRAVEARDASWMVAVVLLTALVTTIALVASDVMYGVLDPRVRDALGRRRGGTA